MYCSIPLPVHLKYWHYKHSEELLASDQKPKKFNSDYSVLQLIVYTVQTAFLFAEQRISWGKISAKQ